MKVTFKIFKRRFLVEFIVLKFDHDRDNLKRAVPGIFSKIYHTKHLVNEVVSKGRKSLGMEEMCKADRATLISLAHSLMETIESNDPASGTGNSEINIKNAISEFASINTSMSNEVVDFLLTKVKTSPTIKKEEIMKVLPKDIQKVIKIITK